MSPKTEDDANAEIQTYREKALREHANMRHWQNRALQAEAQLKVEQEDAK